MNSFFNTITVGAKAAVVAIVVVVDVDVVVVLVKLFKEEGGAKSAESKHKKEGQWWEQ